MDKGKGFSPLVLIVVLAIFVGGGYYIYNKKSLAVEVDTTSWKTCRNEKYGFEFKYPKDWSVMNVGGPRDRRQVNCGENLPVPGYDLRGSGGGVQLRIRNKETQDVWREDFSNINSLDDYVRIVFNRDPDQSNLPWLKRLLRVGGLKMLGGERLYWTGLGHGNLFGVWSGTKLLVTYHQGNIYEFRTSAEEAIFDAILSSFKFIN